MCPRAGNVWTVHGGGQGRITAPIPRPPQRLHPDRTWKPSPGPRLLAAVVGGGSKRVQAVLSDLPNQAQPHRRRRRHMSQREEGDSPPQSSSLTHTYGKIQCNLSAGICNNPILFIFSSLSAGILSLCFLNKYFPAFFEPRNGLQCGPVIRFIIPCVSVTLSGNDSLSQRSHAPPPPDNAFLCLSLQKVGTISVQASSRLIID